jgi:hypothetical protein
MNDEIPATKSAAVFQGGPKASFLAVVKCLPFGARFEEIQVTKDPRGLSTEERVTGAIYRDSAGRVRRELHLQRKNEDDLELTTIADFAARTVTALDVAAKIATRFTDMGPPPGHEIPVTGWGYRGPWSLGTAPEERVIEGVACRKAQPVPWPLGSPAEPKVVGEIWVSNELKYSVLERVGDPGREYTWRLYDIRRVEPPSSLFVVPVGYTEVVRSKFDTAPPKR